jgi:acyl carrier protein
MTAEIIPTLSTYIATQVLKQSNRIIQLDEPLLSSGLIDSFSLVDLSIFIEKTFKVYIDDTELNKETFDTLAQLVNIIKARM